MIAVGKDHVLPAHVLGEFLHGAGVGEELQAEQLGSGIVPGELVPCGGVFASAVYMCILYQPFM